MELTYKEILAQDQKKLRTRLQKILSKSDKSVLGLAKDMGLPQTTLRRWFVLEEDLSTYKPLAKIVTYIEKKEVEPRGEDFKRQTNIK